MQSALKRFPDTFEPEFCPNRLRLLPNCKNVRILLLEDEALIALDMRNDLESWGYSTVTIAHSEAHARLKIAKHRPTLAIVDVALQGEEDGIEIANRLKAEFGFSIIFLTAHSDVKTRRRIVESQPLGYLFKPYSSYALHDFLEKLQK